MKSQIWIAITVYLLVAIIKKRLNIEDNLHTIFQILSLTLFEKIPILQIVTDSARTTEDHRTDNQLNLFN